MVKYCSHGLCKSDSRKEDSTVKLAPFPKPHLNSKMAKKWIKLVGRENITLNNITRDTYVCTNHFKEGYCLDWKSNPSLEPFPAHNEEGAKYLINQPSKELGQKRLSRPKFLAPVRKRLQHSPQMLNVPLRTFSRPAKPLMTVNFTIPSQPCNEDLISLNGEILSFLP